MRLRWSCRRRGLRPLRDKQKSGYHVVSRWILFESLARLFDLSVMSSLMVSNCDNLLSEAASKGMPLPAGEYPSTRRVTVSN